MPGKGGKELQMADESTTTQEAEQPAEDWQAKYEEMRTHMREWEKKARANQNAADELEKLKAAQMSEQEKANARADAAEAELAALKAEKAKTDAATKLASETGVPFEMLMFCVDEEAMQEFAATYAKETHVSSAPSALNGSRIVRGDDSPKSTGEMFADFAQGFFK